MKIRRILSFVCLFLFWGAASAHADPLRWNVNFRFADGGAATGYLVWDGLVGPMDWSISTSGGDTGAFPALTYTHANSWSSLFFFPPYPDGYPLEFGTGIRPTTRILRFVTLLPLTDAGGTIGIDLSTADEWHAESFPYSGLPGREIVSGSLTSNAVPEPSTLAALGIGLVVLAGYGWRRSGG